MASPAQITANRANATNSTGPVDTSRTRFNGVAHGLTSKQTVIPGESQQDYDHFAATLRKELKPGSAVENVLIDRLIAAAWRLQRFTRVESAFLTNRIEAYTQANPDTDPDVAMANLFIDPAETARMRLFLRYQTTVQREYDKSFKELQAAKAERRKHERQELALGIYDEAEPEVESSTQSEVGFASHAAATIPVLDDIGFASQQPFASRAA